MATIKYLIQSEKSPANIYLRFSIGRGNSIKRKTGFIIDPENWNKKKGMPRDTDAESRNMKYDLAEFASNIDRFYNESIKKGDIVNGDWLQAKINKLNSQYPDTGVLADYVQACIRNSATKRNHRGGIGLSEGRVKIYKAFKTTIERYQKGVLINEIDENWAEKFKGWLNDQGYSLNYVSKNISDLKMFVSDSGSDRLSGVKCFKIKKTSDEIVFLSPQEQARIADTVLERSALRNARKWLLLGCLLGQRASDLLQLSEAKIVTNGEMNLFEIVQKKTDKRVMVPILPKAMEIIESGFPYPINLQKFNRYIKEICEAAQIDDPVIGIKRQGRGKGGIKAVYPKWEVVSSHCCRRSFATNFYGRIPTPVLIGITGHGTESMFLRYIGKSSMDNARQMFEAFNKL